MQKKQAKQAVTLIRLGQARSLTKGGQFVGQPELDGTYIKIAG